MGWHGPKGNCGCCEEQPGCEYCNPDIAELEVVISGSTNLPTCTNCAALNGTYVLPYLTTSPPLNFCEWELTLEEPIDLGGGCDTITTIEARIQTDFVSVYLQVFFRNTGGTIRYRFQKEITPFDTEWDDLPGWCGSWDDYTVPYLFSGGDRCSGTCKVTAL